MYKKVDLHGMNINEATAAVVLAISEAENNRIDTLEFVTGLGVGILSLTVEQLLDSYNLPYTIENNKASYVVHFVHSPYLDDKNFDEPDEKYN